MSNASPNLVSRKKKVAIFDLDAILVDLMSAWLGWYNNESGDSLTVDDITTWHIHEHVKPEYKKGIYGFFRPPERYGREVQPIPGAADGLQKLHDRGVDIIIATATAGRTAEQKYVLIDKVAPWLHQDHVFIGARKELLRGDFFIDDGPHNIEAYRNAWPDAHILTISYPYNQNCRFKVNLMADGHKDFEGAWHKIVEHILIH